ncbi:MAG: family 16 glycosylhydrolase [Lentisphaeria bacterium]
MKFSASFTLATLLWGICLFASAEHETDQVLYANSFADKSGISVHGTETSFNLESEIADKSGGTLKISIEADHANGQRWPQVLIKFPEPVSLDLTTSVEFNFHYNTSAGKVAAGFGAKPVGSAGDYFFPLHKLAANHWHKLRIPLSPAQGKTAQITGLAFFMREAGSDDKAKITMLINDFRIISSGQIVALGYSLLTPFRAETAPKLMDIEIPNLLVNPYLTVGGDIIPPQGWSFGGRSGTADHFNYTESPVSGRAFEIRGMQDRTIVLSQAGITIVPGEKYRLSGYLKGSTDFDGQGGIGLACDGWHKFWGYKINRNAVKPAWHHFEVEFIPTPEKSNVGRFVMYLHEGAAGTLSIARPVLEALTPTGLKLSKNILAGNDFDERYGKAKADGTLRGGPPSEDYELVWSDEFDGTEIDPAKWNVLDVKQYIESRGVITSPDCVRLDGKGILQMTVFAKDKLIWQPYLSSHNKFATTYGYFECRARFHRQDFVNFAFWMMPEGKMDYRDPINTGMEIDIMECITPSLGEIVHTTHWYSEKIYKSGGSIGRKIPGLSEGFRHIGFEWTPDEYIFYIDGVESLRFNKKDHPITTMKEAIRLNGALNAGKREEFQSETPKKIASFMVDYVRVYQKKRQ